MVSNDTDKTPYMCACVLVHKSLLYILRLTKMECTPKAEVTQAEKKTRMKVKANKMVCQVERNKRVNSGVVVEIGSVYSYELPA